MGKLVRLNLGKGDLNRGFPSVTVQLSEDDNSIPLQLTGSLPASPELIALYERWQLLYKLIYESLYPHGCWRGNESDQEIEIEEEDITNVSIIEFSNLCNELQNTINCWLKSESFRKIDQKLRTKLVTTDEIKIVLQTEDDRTRRLPWHLWNFFDDYPHAIVCLSAPEYEPIKTLKKPSKEIIRILAILGNSQGIDVQKDREMLEQLPGAETIFLVEPQRRELDRWLWDQKGWDVLFFAGHSSTQADGETGKFYINQNDSLTVSQLKNSLRAAIKRGLSLAIFNSCEGLGLACQLISLHIPQMIVMREPVPDLVAQEFLKHFLEAFSQGESFYLAVREAGERLQGLESQFPCASWLPVICQNPAESPLVWPKKAKKTSNIYHNILPKKQIIGAILTTTTVVTVGIMVARSQGFLQYWELQFFDILMRSRPQEKPDPRILIVTVTEADVRSQLPQERGGASLSDRSLAQLIAKLEQFQPRVIGLDIYREAPVKADYPNLANWMKKSDRFIAICKASEDEKNSGVASPPEVGTQRLGFSDVIPDPDGILRRHLLAMTPAFPCSTDKSLSFQLATRYLAYYGIKTKLTPEKNWQFGNIVFENLESDSGGYHRIDSAGHQVLLNWRSAIPVAPIVTLKDVFNNKLTSDLVKDRIVLIGTTAESFHDYWDTPLSVGQWPHKPMSGVIVQAQMVSQIISAVLDRRPLLWVWPKGSEFLWVWCWSLMGGILAWCNRSVFWLGFAIGLTFCLLYGLCLTFLILGVWVPLVPSALALMIASASLLAYRYYSQNL
ncbi:CHASE2 domain-containing protein [Aerosakkonemataceae cyanobacterium BLCC-F50]|uniref:CHASE2 domain-containing protein n=1 Tax=Floridaenema flaviceps BLCC-F50 TaxID=3153642 RepID=A0ABV4XUY8_9CYAN